MNNDLARITQLMGHEGHTQPGKPTIPSLVYPAGSVMSLRRHCIAVPFYASEKSKNEQTTPQST